MLSRCSQRAKSLGRAAQARTLATHTKFPREKHRVAVGILLNRAPILTRTPDHFEQAFYKYQQRIQRALHNPFPFEFYFKQGSLLETQFNKEESTRERKAFGWKPRHIQENASVSVETNQEEEEVMPRRTAADVAGDVQSLDREGSRNLYLLVKENSTGDTWRFPKGVVADGEALHQAALRELHAECGADMNVWVVGRKPIGFFENGVNALADSEEHSSLRKQFFMKAHILAGQVKAREVSVSDFAWLTKQEIESRVSADYWQQTKDMLSDF